MSCGASRASFIRGWTNRIRGSTHERAKATDSIRAEIVEALTEFYEALKQGPEVVAKRFPARTVELGLEPRQDEHTHRRSVSRDSQQPGGTAPERPSTD
jgi:hypothetical protein